MISNEVFAKYEQVAKEHKAKLNRYTNPAGIPCIDLITGNSSKSLCFGFTESKFIKFAEESWGCKLVVKGFTLVE